MVLGLHALFALLVVYLREQRTYVVAQRLAPLVERCLHHPAEEHLVAGQRGNLIAGQPDNGALHLWRRTEHVFIYCEQILHAVPSLQQYAQDAVGAASRTSRHTLCHLALYHACATGDKVAVLQHAEEYLT